MDDRSYQISNLREVLDGSLMAPAFKTNPKYKVDGVPRIDYNDVMSNRYFIKSDIDFPNSGSYWCDAEATIIAQYKSIEEMVDDGWRLD